jgi:hypothetical protein
MPLKLDEEVMASAVAKVKAREATKISLKLEEMTEGVVENSKARRAAEN